jgi:hypothetical protein
VLANRVIQFQGAWISTVPDHGGEVSLGPVTTRLGLHQDGKGGGCWVEPTVHEAKDE